MLTFDHIAVGCETLKEGVAWVEEKLGVTMEQGGQHAHFGTHNMLLRLGPDAYLEVIAKDPDAPATGRPTWFNLDNFTGPPRLCNWICATSDMAQLPEFSGETVNLTRGTLSWQIAVPPDGSLPYHGAYPTLIKWGAGVTHPAKMLKDQGVRLESWSISHPSAPDIAKQIDVAGINVTWSDAPTGYVAEFITPNGRKVLQ